jgi:hypothetical protein
LLLASDGRVPRGSHVQRSKGTWRSWDWRMAAMWLPGQRTSLRAVSHKFSRAVLPRMALRRGPSSRSATEQAYPQFLSLPRSLRSPGAVWRSPGAPARAVPRTSSNAVWTRSHYLAQHLERGMTAAGPVTLVAAQSHSSRSVDSVAGGGFVITLADVVGTNDQDIFERRFDAQGLLGGTTP